MTMMHAIVWAAVVTTVFAAVLAGFISISIGVGWVVERAGFEGFSLPVTLTTMLLLLVFVFLTIWRAAQ